MIARDLPYVTRLLVPEKREDILHRERLVDFLHEQVECRLILISAPAGYGKTTLLTDFARGASGAVCWYSFSEADKDPKVFFEYFVASIRQRFPGFGEKTLGLLDRFTDLSKDLSSTVGVLVNEIHDSIPEYFFVVLDDYHHVDDSPIVNEALDLLLYYLPSNCHIIVSSRTLPKLTLSRLAAQRLVAGIGTSDLRFTVQEIKDFLRSSFKVLLPESMAQQLADSSEGWITAIILGAYGLGQGILETIMRARNSGGPVFDFLASEVFRQQPPEVQRFLLESSVLPQFSYRRCTDILDIADAREMLKTVEERNLFVTRVEGGEWYRYHNLFANYLQSKLKEEWPQRYVDLNVRAGETCRERGELDDAVHHFACAGRYDRVSEIIEVNGESLLDVGKLRTLQRWLDVLPSESLEANPALLAFHGRVLYQVSELDKALEALDRAVDGFNRQGDERSAAKTMVKRSTLLRLKGSRQEAARDCLRVIEMGKGDKELEAEARKGLGIIRGVEGKLNESVSELKIALSIYERLGSTYQMAELNHALGTAHYYKGDLSSALQHYRSSLDLWKKVGNFGLAADILNSLGMISYRQGEYEEALTTLREALDKARSSGYMRIEAHISGSLGSVHRDMDNLDEALAAYESGLDLARRVNEVPLITYLLNEIGGIYRLREDFTRAERLSRQALIQAQEYGGQREAALCQMVLGLLALDRGNPRQSATYLSKACSGLKAAGAQMELARAHYHLANTYLAQGRQLDAQKQMRAVDQIVSTQANAAYLLPEIRRAQQPAEFAVSLGIGSQWIEELRRRLKPSDVSLSSPAAATVPLTQKPTAALPSIQVCALGWDKVICGNRQIADSDWATQTTKELFFYLISQPRGVRRDDVMEALWPELNPARANSNFHVALYRIRRATFSDLFLHQGGRYLLNPSVEVTYDVEEFQESINKAMNCGSVSDEAVPHWEKAAGFYQGPFLTQFYSEWCESKRRGLEQRHLQALGALARYYFKKNDFGSSIPYYEKMLGADPYAEEVHRQLIKAYDLAGDRPAAIRHYNRLVQMLQEELGSEPVPETKAVYNSLLREGRSQNPEQKGKDQRSGNRA